MAEGSGRVFSPGLADRGQAGKPPGDELDQAREFDPHAAPTKRVVADVPARGDSPSGAAFGLAATVQVSRAQARGELDSRLVFLREPDSAAAAGFRILRHRLSRAGDPRSIVVTSAEPDEGKTTCAANLALAMAECSRARVLLIEANLRTPSLASTFNIVPPVCFAAQIASHRDRPLDPWEVVEVMPSLHVAAIRTGEPRSMLDGPAFAFAVDSLRRAGYEYVVLDCPPVLGSADVNVIEDSAEGVLFAVCAGRSSARALKKATEQLAPANILGVALLDQ